MPDNFSSSLVAGVMCLVPAFFLSVLISFGLRSFQAGWRIFLLFFGSITIFLSLGNLILALPDMLLQVINWIVSRLSLVVIFMMGIMGWVNYKNGGKVYDNVKLRQQRIFGYMLGILFLGIFILEIDVNINGSEEYSGNAFFFILAACALFGKEFLSFQLREKGIVFRGRYSI